MKEYRGANGNDGIQIGKGGCMPGNSSTYPAGKGINFEKLLKEYIGQGKGKLEKDLKGTREAIRQLAHEKVKEFMAVNDLGLGMEERRYLAAAIVASMYQAFCYGYSIGRVEGETSEKIML